MDRSNLHLASYGSEQRSAFGCSGARVQGAGGGVNRGGPSPPLSRKIRLSIAGLALLVGSPLQLPGAGAATDAESAPPPDLLSVDAQRNYLRMLYSGVDDEVIWSIFGVKYGRVDNRLQALWKTATIGFSRIVYPQEGGYSLDVLEVVFYTDLESGERLETWFNPYSGREVPVNLPAPVTLSSFHSHVGPSERSAPGGIRVVESVEPPATLGYETWAQIEKHVTVTDEESGKVVFASTEFVDYGARAQDLNALSPRVPATLHLEIVSDWLPWMDMGSRPGGLYTRARGAKSYSLDRAPDELLSLLRRHYPQIAEDPFGYMSRALESTASGAHHERP